MVQQFQNIKNSKKGDKNDQTSPISESEKKINEKMSKMEEMIKMAWRMDDLMDYQSLSLFPNVRLPPKSHLKMYMRAMQPLGATEEI